MIFFNLFRAPKPKVNVDGKPFLKQVGMIVLSTTISLSLTLGVLQLLDMQAKKKDRRLSAMMVMSNIESFARTLELRAEKMAPTDSMAAWLLSMPIEDLELMPEKELAALVDRATTVATLNHDRSAENVFTNNIETWKNVGNVSFIDQVGSCFSAINGVEEQFNDWAKGVSEALHDVSINPDKYEGSNRTLKCLHSDKVRASMAAMHNRRCWLKYAAAVLRYHNRSNMKSIDITEQEVMDYTDNRENDDYDVGEPPVVFDYYTDPISLDSLVTMRAYTERVEELKAAKQ